MRKNLNKNKDRVTRELAKKVNIHQIKLPLLDKTESLRSCIYQVFHLVEISADETVRELNKIMEQ